MWSELEDVVLCVVAILRGCSGTFERTIGFDSRCGSKALARECNTSNYMNRYVLPILAVIGAVGVVGSFIALLNLNKVPMLLVGMMLVLSTVLFVSSCYLWEVELKKGEVDNDK